MATKDCCSLPFRDKHDGISNVQYSNLNLNQNHRYSIDAFSETFKNVTIERRKAVDYDFANDNDSQTKKDPYSWNKSTKDLPKVTNNSTEKEDGFKKGKNLNSSTLSLHIEAYEHSNEANLFDATKNGIKQNGWKVEFAKQVFIDLPAVIQNPFEFPRQQENTEAKMPEISKFKASQKLLNPDQKHQANFQQHSLPQHSGGLSKLAKNRPPPLKTKKLDSTSSQSSEKFCINEEDTVDTQDVEEREYNLDNKGAEMGGMIFDFSAFKTLCMFTDKQNQLPIEPWHIYKPDLRLNLSARYTSFNDISYTLHVQNTSFHMVHNLTIAVAFKPLPFFDYSIFVEDYQAREIILAQAYIDFLHSGSTSICVLDLPIPIFPPFLVTFSTTSGIPAPTTSTSSMKFYIEKVIEEVATKNINFMKLMKLQYSCVLSHFDSLITYEFYKKIVQYSDKKYGTILLGRRNGYNDVSATACIPLNAARAIWNNSYNLEKVYETFVPSASPRRTPIIGYLCVKTMFVEISFSVSIDAKGIHIVFVTPIRRLTLYLQSELQVKFNSLCLLGNHSKPCTIPTLNFMEEKEMIEKGRYKIEDNTSFINNKLVDLLRHKLDIKLEDQD